MKVLIFQAMVGMVETEEIRNIVPLTLLFREFWRISSLVIAILYIITIIMYRQYILHISESFRVFDWGWLVLYCNTLPLQNYRRYDVVWEFKCINCSVTLYFYSTWCIVSCIAFWLKLCTFWNYSCRKSLKIF